MQKKTPSQKVLHRSSSSYHKKCRIARVRLIFCAGNTASGRFFLSGRIFMPCFSFDSKIFCSI